MKQGPDGTAVGRALEPEEFVSRKLIRPTLTRPNRSQGSQEVHSENDAEALPGTSPKQGVTANGHSTGTAATPATERLVRQRPANGKHHSSSEHTHAENFYYQKQVQSRTLMTIVLRNGETIQGTIEWYDKNCIKVHGTGRPNLLIYKPGIRYMHKSDE